MAARWTSSLWLTPPPLWVSTTTAYRELMAFGAWRSSSRWPITFLLRCWATHPPTKDRKSTRLNSSHDQSSYAVFCLKKKKRVSADPSFYDLGLKVGARVVPGTVSKEIATQTLRFHITDGTVNYPVIFKALPPGTFTDSVEVVVEGRLQKDGVIYATNVLAKCGSRYEAVPKA